MGGADGRGGQAWRALTSRSDTSAARRPEPDVPRWLLRLSCLRSSPQPGRLPPAAPEGLAQGSRRGRAGVSAALWRAGEGRGRAEGNGRAGPSPERTAAHPRVPPGVGSGPRGRVGTCGAGVGPVGRARGPPVAFCTSVARLVRLTRTPQVWPALWQVPVGLSCVDTWLSPGGLDGGLC